MPRKQTRTEKALVKIQEASELLREEYAESPSNPLSSVMISQDLMVYELKKMIDNAEKHGEKKTNMK